MPSFLNQKERKYSDEIKAVLHGASRLKTICLNEIKLNSAYGLVVRKTFHDGLSCKSMNVMYEDAWSRNTSIPHAKRLHVDQDAFTTAGKNC